jgi:hypothetical protein
MDQDSAPGREALKRQGKAVSIQGMRVVYALISLFLGLIALTLMASAVYEVWPSLGATMELVPALLDAVALIVIGMAVFDVSKFLVEEEVFGAEEQISEGAQRNTLIKFLVIITIAMLMEALVFVFAAAKRTLPSSFTPPSC